MLERSVRNAVAAIGWKYEDIQTELFSQGVDVGETPIRRAMRKLREKEGTDGAQTG